MSTRSRVGIENADGSITSIYVHFDGYLGGVGHTLSEYYRDRTKVEGLIALGDLSSLHEELGEKHDFNVRSENWCCAYGRDRGEEGTEAHRSPDLADFAKITRDCNGEFAYLFATDGKWLVNDFHESRSGDNFEDLATAIARTESESEND